MILACCAGETKLLTLQALIEDITRVTLDSLAVSFELLGSKRIVESSPVKFGPHDPHEPITQWHVLNVGSALIALLFIPSECIFELHRDILEIHLNGLLHVESSMT